MDRESLLRAAQDAFEKNNGRPSNEVSQATSDLMDSMTEEGDLEHRVDTAYRTSDNPGGIKISHVDDPYT